MIINALYLLGSHIITNSFSFILGIERRVPYILSSYKHNNIFLNFIRFHAGTGIIENKESVFTWVLYILSLLSFIWWKKGFIRIKQV
jgi:hypothetical protein